MARKKTVKGLISNVETTQQASKALAEELADAFDDYTMEKY